jgi:uncharacterized protein YlxW (UPF0749 family)
MARRFGLSMSEERNGDWVEYDDYKILEEENSELKTKVEELEDRVNTLEDELSDYQG